ncbi:hypothetical protein GJAV_G00111020 [Gymnothorax javanicus]|nr:hypothetical protein GJAV_G00111020 [Gymnothorax javanicus]
MRSFTLMAGKGVTLCLVLSLWCMACAGPLSRSPCELLPLGEGHPVQALMKSFTAMSGCASRGTTGLPQEVHIINLKSHGHERPEEEAERGKSPAAQCPFLQNTDHTCATSLPNPGSDLMKVTPSVILGNLKDGNSSEDA